MGDVDIKARVSVDTGNASNQIGDIKKDIKGLGDETKKVGSGQFEGLKNTLKGIGPAAQDAAKGSGLLNTALNVLKANPIILVITTLVGIIVTLFSHFKKMEGVSDSLGKAWGTLGGIISGFMNKVLTPLIDGFVKLVELFTSGVVYVLDKLGVTSEETAKRLGEMTEALDDLEDAEKNAAIATAESNRRLQEARERAADATIPIRERIKALKEAGRIEKEELDKVVKINTEKAKLLMEQMATEMGMRDDLIKKIREGSMESLKAAREELMAQKNVDKERLREIDAMIIAAQNAAADSAKTGKRIETQITAMEKEEQDKRRAQHEAYLRRKAETEAKREQDRIDKAEAAEKAHSLRHQQILNERKQWEKDNDKEKFDTSTSQLRAMADARITETARAIKTEMELEEEKKKFEELQEREKQQRFAETKQLMNDITTLVGEQTAVGKTMGVATATINTYQGVSEVWKQKSALPSPFDVIAKVAATATVVASGLSAVKNIMRVRVPGKGSGGDSPSTGSLTASAPLAPAIASTALNASSIQAVGNAASGGTARAFVLSSDIQNDRERIERINRAARI